MKYFIIFVVVIIVFACIVQSILEEGRRERIEIDQRIGHKFIVNKDTVFITSYNSWSNNYGGESRQYKWDSYSADLIKKCKQVD